MHALKGGDDVGDDNACVAVAIVVVLAGGVCVYAQAPLKGLL